MLKYIFATLFIFSSAFSFGQKNHFKDEKLPWIKFYWKGDKLGKQYYDKAYMYVPVKIQDLPNQFDAQFDLGSIVTVLYGRPVASYQKQLPELQQTNDTLHIKGRKFPLLKNVTLHLDQVTFPNLSVVKMNDFGKNIPADSINTGTVRHIGTIGTDIFKDKVLIIDYPNQRMCTVDSLPLSVSNNVYFFTTKFNSEDRVSIAFKMGKQTSYLMFDTGSSIMTVHTLTENAALITDPKSSVIDSLPMSTWGKINYTYKKKINKTLSMGKFKLKDQYVYYSDHAVSSPKFFSDNGIFGYTGNVFFLDKVVVIDFKNKKMGVL